MATPKVGLLIPGIWGDAAPPFSEMEAFFRKADELGFDSLYAIDRIFHAKHLPHPLTMLSFAAAVTERIGLGTAVLLLASRNPIEVAQQAATLNALSGERLTLGVSLGGQNIEYQAMNQPVTERAGRLVEGVKVMRKLFTEDKVNFDGKYYHLQDATINPKPKKAGGIPIPFGAATEPSLRRAGRLSDGWFQGGRGTPETFSQAWQIVRASAGEAGRDPDVLVSGKLLYGNPGPKEAASDELQRYLSNYYGPNYPMEFTALGTPAEIAATIRGFGDAGCQLVMLGLPGPNLSKLEFIASEVLPLLEAK